MAYEPTTWKSGDVVTSSKLNKLEQGVAGASLVVNVDMQNMRFDKTAKEIGDACKTGVVVLITPSMNEHNVVVAYFVSKIVMADGDHAGQIAINFYLPVEGTTITAYALTENDYPVPEM